MNTKELQEIQKAGIEKVTLTLAGGQKKQFDDRYMLMIVESIGDDNQPIGSDAVLKTEHISDDEILAFIQYVLMVLVRKGVPVAHILLNMLKDIYEEANVDNESGDN